MDFSIYQQLATETNELPAEGPANAIAAMLGLASESGAILNVYKQFLRRNIDLSANTEFLTEELGDLLWYTATIATCFGLDLDEIAEANLKRTRDYYLIADERQAALERLPVLDKDFPADERFPRRLTIEFSHVERGVEQPVVAMRAVAAEPYAFAGGLDSKNGKPQGFVLGEQLGDTLTDNSNRADGYRFHDAIHLGLCAVLGWSPNTRALLHLKRRSQRDVDEAEDGARAIFTEEGIIAMLAKLSVRRLGFQAETNVDMETIGVARAVVSDLEVRVMPGWVWQRAICQGFRAMHALQENRTGFLILNLDERRLDFEQHWRGDGDDVGNNR